MTSNSFYRTKGHTKGRLILASTPHLPSLFSLLSRRPDPTFTSLRQEMGATAVDIAAGFAAGVNVTLVGHPFETVKVR